MNSKLALIVILGGLAVIFVAQNATEVEIGLLFWTASMSAALLIFFTLIAGFLLGWSLHSYLAYRKSRDEYVYLE